MKYYCQNAKEDRWIGYRYLDTGNKKIKYCAITKSIHTSDDSFFTKF